MESSEVEKVCDHVGLYLLVQRTIARQTWRQIHFKKPGIEPVVNHNIEAENLETIIPVRHVHLERAVQKRFHRYKRFHYDVFYFGEKQIVIHIVCLQNLTKSLYTPFGATRVLSGRRILLELFIVFVD